MANKSGPRVAKASLPSSGVLGYAKKGQMTVRPQAHSGKPVMKAGAGIYPSKRMSK